jgi:hypothetical protein
MVRDLWTIKTWTFRQGQHKSLNFAVHIDAEMFDGSDAQAEQAIAQTLERLETSVRAAVSDHRHNAWNPGIRPPRPLTRKTGTDDD